LRRDGPNLLPQAERRSAGRIVLGVLAEPMLLLLLGAAAIYLLLGDPQEAALLGISVLLVIAMTVYQEQRAETALQALRDLSSPRARVWRDGRIAVLPARGLVVGDRIELAEGDRVPADARLCEATDFEVDESLLTGESLPVERTIDAESASSVHASTLVVRGHGSAEVTAIGVATEVGRIGEAMRGIRRERSPMQQQIRGVVLLFTALALGSSLLITLLYALKGGAWLDAILAGITLAIATIPEEFPVVLTVFLAFGGWRMARRHALVRRAPAIEALGAVQVLCTDKTGTLTENRMAVAGAWPGFSADGADPARADALLRTALAASPPQSFDAMEQALRDVASLPGTDAAAGHPEHLREYPLAPECPAMAHAWKHSDRVEVACKGAPETVAKLCGLDGAQNAELQRTLDTLAGQGLRLLGVAETHLQPGAELPVKLQDLELQWRGLVGFADPLREGVIEAVAEVRAAGVRVLMLTGDHLRTAGAIAARLGIDRNGGALLGAELDELNDVELDRVLADTVVFARVRPEHKLRLVEALKRRDWRVAMTGDGVNDAPALMAAQVGVAMGGRGTDVAREAASIVLLDDNFITIVDAIRMGRGIYDNIRRALRYILAVHVPITGLALLPLLVGGSWVLLPLHVVFLELIIDPACSIVFEREPAEDDIMRRPPRPSAEPMLGWRPMLSSLLKGSVMFGTVAAVYLVALKRALPPAQISALAFTALVAGNIGLIAVFRSGKGLGRALSRRNTAFWVVSLAALIALVVATRLPGLADLFGFAVAPMPLWLAALGIPFAVAMLIRVFDSLGGKRRGQIR